LAFEYYLDDLFFGFLYPSRTLFKQYFSFTIATMLTFSHLQGSSVRVTGGGIPVVSFPDKIVDGAVNLLPSPQEFPSREQLSWPGEYDVAGVTIRGIGQQEGQKVSYVVESDGVRIAFPNSPLEAWDDADIERMGEVQVLVLPAEDPKLCQALLDELDPRVLIIVPTAGGSLHPDVLKACGAADKEHVSEYKLKGAMPAEGREVVVFG
jgi:hypothetical protein